MPVDQSAPEPTATVSSSGFLPATAARLLVFAAGGRATFPLPTVGEVVDVCVDDPTLSRRHARIRMGVMIAVTDLGSRDGTTVGGRSLVANQAVKVTPGEAFALGKVV